MIHYINSYKPNAVNLVSQNFKHCILSHTDFWNDLVFLCIGTDKITGDCLGPYIGTQLSSCTSSSFFVYGTLKYPIHALNISDTLHAIKKDHFAPLIIAIDAALGQKKHLGYVTIGNGSLYPGAGVHKKLTPVGDIYITGIVNIYGLFEQLTLQTTRLNNVIELGNVIAQGILKTIPFHFL